MKRPLRIGDRVRLRGRPECASVFANPYTFRRKPEARPLSFGALAGGTRCPRHLESTRRATAHDRTFAAVVGGVGKAKGGRP